MNDEFKKNFDEARKRARNVVYSESLTASIHELAAKTTAIRQAVVEQAVSAKEGVVSAVEKGHEKGVFRDFSSQAAAGVAGVVATVKAAGIAIAAAVIATPHVAGGAAIMHGLATAGAVIGGGAVAGIAVIGIGSAATGAVTYHYVRKITRKNKDVT
jgi:hypothetical protein